MPDDNAVECFVDTNVWLYALIDGDDRAKSDIARDLVQTARPVVSVQVINETCVNLLRRADFSEAQVRDLIRAFCEKYRVIDLTESILLRASQLRERYSLSFWDGLIVASAMTANVGVLYTEDMQHGLCVDETLLIQNPFDTL